MTADAATYLEGKARRHAGLLSAAEQERLARATVCVAGTGGVGGWTCEALARAGVGRFRVADPETYEPSNANRQAGCNVETVGRNKAEVTAEAIRRVHPAAEVAVFPRGVTEENLAAFLDGADLVVDGIDLACLAIKKRLFDAARSRGLSVLSGPILGFGCALALFHPTRSPTFEAFFGPLPPEGDAGAKRRFVESLAPAFFSFRPRLDWPLFRQRVHAGQVPSVGVATMLSGALAATAAIGVLCGRRDFPEAPVTLHVDLRDGRIARTGPLKRRLVRLAMRAAFRRLARAAEPAPAGG